MKSRTVVIGNNEGMQVPILFLIFNRPKTTREVFESIRSQRPQKLYVAADGPRELFPEDNLKCEEARKSVTESIDWECETHFLFRDTNLGCGKAVSSAITWFFEKEEMGIILEDDCLPVSTFYPFCEKMLSLYRDKNEVKMVSGVNYFLGHIDQDGYCFSKFGFVWGWATWKRAWMEYQFDLKMEDIEHAEKLFWRNFKNTILQTWLLDIAKGVQTQKIDTWDIQWVYTIQRKEGYSIVPYKCQIQNIGATEGSHIHPRDKDHGSLMRPVLMPLELHLTQHKIEVDQKLEKLQIKNMLKYFIYAPSISQRIKNYVRTIWNGLF